MQFSINNYEHKKCSIYFTNKSLLSLLIILITFTSFAQQGINYKAIIKDAQGNVIANDLVQVQFSIRTSTNITDNVYVETHTPTTDSNGLIVLNIGAGTIVSGVFTTIDWGNSNHYLNVQLNPGGGYVDMGTTQFMAVPYTKHALKATQADTSLDTKWDVGTTTNDITNNNTGKVAITNNLEIGGTLTLQTTATINEFSIDGTLADNSDAAIPTEHAVKTYVDTNVNANLATGLEALDEGNGIGWRLKGRNPNLFGNIGFDAVDLSYADYTSTTLGATSIRSTAMGYNTTASGQTSTAMGYNTTASGQTSTAMGYYTTASGTISTAIGYNTTAHSAVETVFGSKNSDYTPISTTGWNDADRLFVVGNGNFIGLKSNALTILKNGNVALGNITPEYILDIDGRARIRQVGSDTAGIWYSDENGVNSMFAGAKTHSNVGASREWGLYINGAYRFWVNGAGNATLTGSLTQNSDRRLKTKIKDLNYGLNTVLQLQPKQYFWKERKAQQQASLGLIAQEVQKIIPNIVHTGTDDKKTLSLSYIELIPVLINAIKEQQKIIDNQDNKYVSLLERVEALEKDKEQTATSFHVAKTTAKRD